MGNNRIIISPKEFGRLPLPRIKVRGHKLMKEVVPMDEIPIWDRPSTVLLLGPQGIGRPDYAFEQGLEVRLYGVIDATVNVPGEEGNDCGSLGVKSAGVVIKGDIETGK